MEFLDAWGVSRCFECRGFSSWRKGWQVWSLSYFRGKEEASTRSLFECAMSFGLV